MPKPPRSEARRLGLYSLSFVRQSGLRAMMRHLGYAPVPGPLSRNLDCIAIWGNSLASERGARAAHRRNLPLIHLEEPLLRSVTPEDTTPIGLFLDTSAAYYDGTKKSDLEHLLQSDATTDPSLKTRAKDGLKLLKSLKLSKYNNWAGGDLPPAGFILVIDQSSGDASIRRGRADAASFATMLATAKSNHPGLPVYIRRHPRGGEGHFTDADLDERTQFLPPSLNPWDVLAAAGHVYTVTSQMGLEAIFASHRPHVFGAPFYAGWGLTTDHLAFPDRTSRRSAEQVFAAAYLLYPTWYDPDRDQLTDFETAARQLACQRDHWQRNRKKTVCLGVRKWKQQRVAAFLSPATGPSSDIVFASDTALALRHAAAADTRLVVWASQEPLDLAQQANDMGIDIWRLEDGFLRSIGLGANLFPALSLVSDDLGIYYDPSKPSRLERLIAGAASLDAAKRTRVQKVIAFLRQNGVTKYNQGNPMPTIPARQDRPVILVPGQVEDDASIMMGTDKIRTNLALLREVRAAKPDAFIIYKPHPDVEAGLRPGALPDLPEGLVDLIAQDTNPAEALAHADEVWTMTSLMGFEALIRSKPVTTLGTPFYAGWGLTTDLGPPIYRRRARPTLEGLVHAALIDYPDYINPDTGRISSVEATLERLSTTYHPSLSPLAKLQKTARKFSWLWRSGSKFQ